MLTELVPGVTVATASMFTTTNTVVTGRAGDCLVIDPAVSVAEVTALAGEVRGAGLRPVAGFATHPHWDHLLWSGSLGADVPRYASPVCVAAASRPGLIAQVEDSAPGHDLALFACLLPLASDIVPWDGPVARVITHDAHAPGHSALFLPDFGVLVAGDMLSDIEIPLLDTGTIDPFGDYRVGLDLLAAVDGVRWVVPGHGHVGNAAEFRHRVDADRRYLDALTTGGPYDDPRLDGGPDWLRQAHDAQARRRAP
jgi:glyoxylase-like metal-dependent hydrolase (beta-lactamase superfamily II)